MRVLGAPGRSTLGRGERAMILASTQAVSGGQAASVAGPPAMRPRADAMLCAISAPISAARLSTRSGVTTRPYRMSLGWLQAVHCGAPMRP